ncbi:MAG: potassium transporter TrkG [Synechococcus sp.]
MAAQAGRRWWRRLGVPQFTVLSGALVIAVGTVLLALPICSSDSVGLWEALFTVTSAITVTGLSIIDVGRELTPFGQGVLALLILVGGLGLMAITSVLQGVVLGGAALRQRLDRGRSLDVYGVGAVGDTLRAVLRMAAVVIGSGALLLFLFGFRDIEDPGRRLWVALFHAISAYNNAGFGLFSTNLEPYRDDLVVNAVIAVLIVMGGIGWRVCREVWGLRRGRRRGGLSLHTWLVLRSTLALLGLGTGALLVTERFAPDGLLSSLGPLQQLKVALFHAVSARTAGFNTVPLSLNTFSDAALLVLVVLMFIGASPGGTGGGVKTTTIAVLVAATRSTLRGNDDVVIRRRRLEPEVLLRAVGVVLASLVFVVLMAVLLGLGPTSGGEPSLSRFTFLEKLFTCVSAFATVGLDVGVTAQLSRWGQLVLMVGMFVGRLGILLILSAVYGTRSPARVRYPVDDLIL